MALCKYKWSKEMRRILLILLSFIFLFSTGCKSKHCKNKKTAEIVTVLSPHEDSILVAFQPKRINNKSEQIIQRLSYLCSYNKETRSANWVAWYLTKEHTNGPYKTRYDYLEDDTCIENRQRLEDWDSLTTVAYDHGHLCPAGDNKWNEKARYETYYLSNMCVQNRDLNQGRWNDLENKCRSWANKFGGIYIVAGPIYKTKPYTLIGNKLSIPDAFYKVVFCVSDSSKAIGFVYDNCKPVETDRIENHVVSVDSVEIITGFDFFSTLPDSIENDIESESNLSQWKVY